MIDLHTHTTASDGTLSFEELVAGARQSGLKAIAITDHDTVESAAKITSLEPIEVIPGVELTVFDFGLNYLDIHVLGLFIDPKNRKLNSKLASLERQREDQKKETIKKLNELGYDISFEEVRAKAKGSIGRPHIAKVLVEKYPQEFPSIPAAFEKLLGNGKPGYIGRKAGFTLREAIDLIHAAGGLSFIAHPFVYPYNPAILAEDFRRLGGDGIETYYDYAFNRPELKLSREDNARMIEDARSLASRMRLLECGGSDFHGKNKNQKIGIFGTPVEVLTKLKAARAAR